MLFNAASGRFQQQWAEKKWPAFQKTNHVMKLLEVRLLGVDASWSQVPGAISTRRWNRKTTRHEYSHSHLRSVGGRRSAHRDRRQHEKNIKTSLELNSGPFHNIMLNMNRIKYIFIHQENDIYLFREFWQPCFFFVLLTFIIIDEAVPFSLAAGKDRSALHWQRIFYYMKQQALSPPLNYCQHRYLLQHQIGLVTKWRIWIIHSI